MLINFGTGGFEIISGRFDIANKLWKRLLNTANLPLKQLGPALLCFPFRFPLHAQGLALTSILEVLFRLG